MTIELAINDQDFIILTPFKKLGAEPNIYELLDENNKSWMELQLVNSVFEVQTKDSLIVENEHDLRSKLDQLVLEVIEIEQSGTENTGTELTEEITPYNPDDIKVHSKQFSIKLIDEMIDNEDIDFTPDFQRNLVWNSNQKSRLIESILLRIPLPMFYFAEDNEGRITVVDGLQRLSTVKEFMDNKFPLKGLQYLGDSCNGRYYSDKTKDGKPNGKKGLDPKYLRWFNMTQFAVNVIDPSSPAKVKYDIFRRINTGGKPLNNQEIRNCLAGKNLRETLKDMVNLPEFKTATDYSIKSTRMDDQEIALRFILFTNMWLKDKDIESYNGYMDYSLDELTEATTKLKKEDLEVYIDLFSTAMKNAEYLFGRRFAFRKVMPIDIRPGAYKQLINKALFVCVSVILARFNHEEIKAQNPEKALLEPLANEITENRQLLFYLSYGTNAKANLSYTFFAIEHLVSSHLLYK